MQQPAFGLLIVLSLSLSTLMGQEVVDVNNLPEPNQKALNVLTQKVQSARVVEKGYQNLNEHGINIFAPSLVEAIRFHLKGAGARIQGDRVILRQTMSIQYMRERPLWVLDGLIYDNEPYVNFNTIRKVRVLRSAAETNRYGSQGNAGVIEIITD